MIQMLGQVTNLIMPKFIARKPKILLMCDKEVIEV